MTIGIDKIGFATSQYVLKLQDLAEARGIDPEKLSKGLLLEELSIAPLTEDIVTLAASASDSILTEQERAEIDMVIVATFIAAIIGSCVSQILSILYKTPAVVFILAILAPLVPGYLSYRTTAFFVTGDYSHAIASATLVVMLALVISIGMASGTVILRLYSYLRKQQNS